MPPNQALNSEAALLKRASQGDKRAFGDLYELYLDQVYRYVYYRIGDETEAEDVTETVFLNAWQTLPRLVSSDGGVRNFRAWLYRIAHNLVVDYHRSSQPSVSLDEAFDLLDPAEGPETSAQAQQDSQRLAAAITQLEPNLQQVLVCRFINHLSHAETAKIMGVKNGHVRVLQHRALKKMAQLLRKDEV